MISLEDESSAKADAVDAPFRGVLAATFGPVAEALSAAGHALPAPTASDRSAWTAASASALVTRAEADRTTPWPQPLASAAARVHRDGDRSTWEQTAFARQHRLSRAVIAAAISLDDAWIDEVVDGVQLLCEQSSWCWPAHDDTFERHGSVLATVTDPYLDLGAGEVVGQLAWIDHVLGDQLDVRAPGIRSRIRHEARTRIFTPFLARRDWHWLGLDGDVRNWNPWIHGNVLVAALRLLDDPAEVDVRTEILSLVVEGLDRYVSVLPADGAIDEGYAYWWNGACRALEALDALSFATVGALDAREIGALRETVAFPHRSHLGGEWYLNLADGQARVSADQPWQALHRAALQIGDADAAAHAAAHRDVDPSEAAGLGRLVRALTDTAWVSASAAVSPLPRDVWLPSTQVLLAREQAGSAAGLTLAIKGGHNGEHHNHNDVGSFVVASDGVPVIIDAGRPTYTKATFGPGRYDIWTMQSSWHNVPEIAGTAQSAGTSSAAADATAMLTDAVSALSLDIAGAYPIERLRSWRRTATLDRGASAIRIDDAWDVDGAVSIRMLVAGDVVLIAGGALITPIAGASPLIVSWPDDISVQLAVRELDDPMLSDVWGTRLTRIELDASARRSVTVGVERDTATPGERASLRRVKR
ncbi:heparinase II/III family protein [Microbacterium sp. SD291]|uniref:heparinase II/III domain-containing protein n=1 Tax=Microbacterium sp. SD291 TaxID=2782007 RepID=UPI0027DDE8ED|nr:heparinase II/III family protein [Microbacterium sp. SD291]